MIDLLKFEAKVNEYKSKVLALFDLIEENNSEEDSEMAESHKSQSESNMKSKTESQRQSAETNWNKRVFYKNKELIENTELDTVKQCIEEGSRFRLNLVVIDILNREVKAVEKWVQTAKSILDEKVNQDFNFDSVEELYKEGLEFNIRSSSISTVLDALKPIVSWKEEADKFIERQSTKVKPKGKKKGESLHSNKMHEIMMQLPTFFEETSNSKDAEFEFEVRNTSELVKAHDEEMPDVNAALKDREEAGESSSTRKAEPAGSTSQEQSFAQPECSMKIFELK
uniref:Lysine-specific demethylase-like domain-containing protein n=1 Tax=Euplotes harpa TaxID=151035 RepID=A0A7S3J557_9SPIT|mmetsp:Transcript_20617/g.23828  ORF Transcript_20617/g.23828 Transcript_20617/m.23828 type:complete len:283 (+) Transcript_20617:1595-2443(+)